MYWIIEGILNLLYHVGMTVVGLFFIVATTYFVGLFGGTAWEIQDAFRTGRYQNGDSLIGAGFVGGIWALFVCLNAPTIGAMALACFGAIVFALVANILLYVTMGPVPPRPASEFD
jgi:hypothetical protein